MEIIITVFILINKNFILIRTYQPLKALVFMKSLLTYVVKKFVNSAHYLNPHKPYIVSEKKIVAKENLALDVPFSQKDEAKSLGAKWNPEIKKWYVPKGREVLSFKQWMPDPNDVSKITLNSPLYLACSYQICWKCLKEYQVFCLSDRKVYFSFVKSVSKSVDLILKERTPTYFIDYSNTVKYCYYMNHCGNCNAKSGDFFLHQKEDSPFLDADYGNSSKIKLIKLDFNPDEKIEIELS